MQGFKSCLLAAFLKLGQAGDSMLPPMALGTGGDLCT